MYLAKAPPTTTPPRYLDSATPPAPAKAQAFGIKCLSHQQQPKNITVTIPNAIRLYIITCLPLLPLLVLRPSYEG